MRTDSVKKYVIPNIPYLFIGWACLKLGTAYRLAPGVDLPHKLMGLGQTIGPAFADFAPGLDPLDWLIGIVGAVGFRLLIYAKSKKAKKYRRDEEYGSARWGGPKDIAPFVDPVFENNVILTGTEFLTMNTRPKNPANARNLNACVIGSSGSGKTRFWLTPQILQASAKKKDGCSYVVVDPKGGVLSQVGAFLQRRGYKIKVFNSIDFSKSMHYNPLAYIRNEADILKFVDALISNTKGEGKEGDPFWTKAETLLYCALIAYIIFEGPAEDRNMNTLVDMISGMEVKEDNENFMNAVDYKVNGFAVGGDDYIVKPFSLMELEARVCAHLRREARHNFEAQVKFSGDLTIDYSERCLFFGDQRVGLAKKEFDIVELLSQNPGQVFDKERIYERIWGYDSEGDSSVVAEHIRRIRTKIAAYTDRVYIETVWGCGYKWLK